jgi:hypothetical protein
MDVLAVNGKRNNNSFCLFFLFMTWIRLCEPSQRTKKKPEGAAGEDRKLSSCTAGVQSSPVQSGGKYWYQSCRRACSVSVPVLTCSVMYIGWRRVMFCTIMNQLCLIATGERWTVWSGWFLFELSGANKWVLAVCTGRHLLALGGVRLWAFVKAAQSIWATYGAGSGDLFKEDSVGRHVVILFLPKFWLFPVHIAVLTLSVPN